MLKQVMLVMFHVVAHPYLNISKVLYFIKDCVKVLRKQNIL